MLPFQKLSEIFSKNAKHFWLKRLHFGKSRGKIKNFSSHVFVCRKFAAVCRKIASTYFSIHDAAVICCLMSFSKCSSLGISLAKCSADRSLCVLSWCVCFHGVSLSWCLDGVWLIVLCCCTSQACVSVCHGVPVFVCICHGVHVFMMSACVNMCVSWCWCGILIALQLSYITSLCIV